MEWIFFMDKCSVVNWSRITFLNSVFYCLNVISVNEKVKPILCVIIIFWTKGYFQLNSLTKYIFVQYCKRNWNVIDKDQLNICFCFAVKGRWFSALYAYRKQYFIFEVKTIKYIVSTLRLLYLCVNVLY